MKRTFSLFTLIMAYAISCAQTTKTFKYGDFEGLANNSCIDVQCVFAPSKAGTLEVTATDLGFEYFETECSKGTITLSIKKNRIHNICKEYGKAVLYYSNSLSTLQINGSGSISIPSIDAKRNVAFQINGSGEIDAKTVNADSFVASVNGSGDIDAKSVKAQSITASINGSGDIEIDNAQARSIFSAVNGSGDIEIKNILSTEVEASIIGSGDISLSGTTKDVTFIVSGSGDIEAHHLNATTITASVNSSGEITYNKSANREITISGRKSNVIAK